MFSAGVSGCISALTMVRWRESRLIAKVLSYQRASYGAGQNTFCQEAIGFQGFAVNFAKSWNAVVPFEQGRSVADALHCAVIEFPDRIDHRMIVGIENIFFVFGMAGDVNLRDAFGGNAIYVIERIETVILRRDVDIVYVEQDAAVGAFHDFVQKFPFGHFGNVEFGVAADVFDGDRDFQIVAHIANFLGSFFRGFKRIRHGQQVVSVTAVDASPAQVVGNPGSLGALDQLFQFFQVLAVDSVRRAEVHGDAVLHDAILIENLIENAQGPSAADHKILGNDFEPVHNRFAGQDMVVVRGAQTDPDAVVRESIET